MFNIALRKNQFVTEKRQINQELARGRVDGSRKTAVRSPCEAKVLPNPRWM